MEKGLRALIRDVEVAAFEMGFTVAMRALRPDLLNDKVGNKLLARCSKAYKTGIENELSEDNRFLLLDEAISYGTD